MDFSENIAVFLSAGVALLSLTAWGAFFPRFSVALLGISLVAGQMVRIPVFGQVGGVLVSDAAVVVVLLAAIILLVRKGPPRRSLSSLRAVSIALLTLPFIAWSLFTLVMRVPGLSMASSLVATSYWVRLSAYLFLLPALLLLMAHHSPIRAYIRRVVEVSAAALVLLGYVQLVYLPRLANLPSALGAGWDPHEFRMVSTWLDPNYLGVFFVIMLIYLGAHLLHSRGNRLYWALGAAVFCALLFTQSRSSVLALGVSLVAVSPFFTWKFFQAGQGKWLTRPVRVQAGIVVVLIFVVGAFSGLLLWDRLLGALIIDTTAQLRISALAEAWHAFAEDTAFFGVGYNAYQFAAVEKGITNSASLHSRAGTDNSLLTLWITTGVPGALLFLMPWVYGARVALQSSMGQRERVFTLLVPPASLLAVLVHSQFVNSLLYAHVLITISLIWALSLSTVTD